MQLVRGYFQPTTGQCQEVLPHLFDVAVNILTYLILARMQPRKLIKSLADLVQSAFVPLLEHEFDNVIEHLLFDILVHGRYRTLFVIAGHFLFA